MNNTAKMDGKIYMVTGASDGIGRQTAKVLLQMGAQVVGVGRNPQKVERTTASLKQETGSDRLTFLLADFAEPAQIQQLVSQFRAKYDRLDVLINNAGTVTVSRQETAAGLEKMFAVNHLGYFSLTLQLLDLLKASAPARIVNVASDAHEGLTLNFDDLQSKEDFSPMRVYGRSKLANIYFTYELAERLAGTGVTVNALHPGFVATNIGADNIPLIGGIIKKVINLTAMNVEKGAQTSIYLATSAEVADVTGKYFVAGKPIQSSPVSYDETAAKKLWEISEQLTGLPDKAAR